MTLDDTLPPLTAPDLADGRGVYPKALGDLLVAFGTRSDFAHCFVGDFELGDLVSESGASVALPVVRVLSGGSGDDVSRVYAARVSTEVASVPSPPGRDSSREDQGCTVQPHAASIQVDASVPVFPSVKGMRHAFVRRLRVQLANGGAKPAKSFSVQRSARERIAVGVLPLVMGRAESKRIVPSRTTGHCAGSIRHTSILSNGAPCCLLAAHIVLGVPTE
jgi:hypothetical protein